MRVLRVRVVPKGTCACKMVAGDVRRVAQGSFLVGYYLGCASCGMVNVILADEYEIREKEETLESFSPAHACTRCTTLFHVADAVFEVGGVALSA